MPKKHDPNDPLSSLGERINTTRCERIEEVFCSEELDLSPEEEEFETHDRWLTEETICHNHSSAPIAENP